MSICGNHKKNFFFDYDGLSLFSEYKLKYPPNFQPTTVTYNTMVQCTYGFFICILSRRLFESRTYKIDKFIFNYYVPHTLIETQL